MKRKGFTLIELLAVIVILAIIALIAIPVVMNIINKANKSAFKDSAYGIMKAGELYYSERLLEPNEEITDIEFKFPDRLGNLQIKGNIPSSGNMIVSKEGKIAIAVTNGKYCVRKGYIDNDVTIDEDIEDCKTKEQANFITITNITLSEVNIELAIGEKKTITTTIEPSNATLKDIKWTSNDKSILTVTDKGEIKAIKSGTAKVKAETMDGSNIIKEVNVTVKQSVTKLEVNTTSVSIINGGTYTIVPTIEPDNASNKELKWTSLNSTIATVDESGLITGIKGGSTTIKVETIDGSNLSKTIEVAVRQQVTNINLSTTSVKIIKGNNSTVTATVVPEDAYLKTLRWTSSDPSIATVANGLITGIKSGTTTIKVETIDGSNIVKNISVTVSEIMTSTNICIKYSSICPNGTMVNVKVNTSENYDFYVIKDTGNELTLIMNKNLGTKIAWINKTDYMAAGGINFGDYGNNEKGPLTALKTLENGTSTWINVPTMSYTLTDDGGGNRYSPITRSNVRARMLTYTEATELGCTGVSNSCPNYLYMNSGGYWLSSTYISEAGRSILSGGSVNATYVYGAYYSVRPVITMSKNL